MSVIDATRGKVQRILTNALGSVRVDSDGDFVIRHNSANAYVAVNEGFGEDGVIVRITCPLLKNVKVTDELCRWIATEGQQYRVGGTSLEVNANGNGWVFFRHHMIADDLDESELMGTLGAVLFTSDDLDNQLQARFGGELFGDE